MVYVEWATGWKAAATGRSRTKNLRQSGNACGIDHAEQKPPVVSGRIRVQEKIHEELRIELIDRRHRPPLTDERCVFRLHAGTQRGIAKEKRRTSSAVRLIPPPSLGAGLRYISDDQSVTRPSQGPTILIFRTEGKPIRDEQRCCRISLHSTAWTDVWFVFGNSTFKPWP